MDDDFDLWAVALPDQTIHLAWSYRKPWQIAGFWVRRLGRVEQKEWQYWGAVDDDCVINSADLVLEDADTEYEIGVKFITREGATPFTYTTCRTLSKPPVVERLREVRTVPDQKWATRSRSRSSS